MMDLNSIPKLAPGCRLHPTEEMLLVPEGALNLTGPTRDILLRIDGSRNVMTIAEDLCQQYAGADITDMQTDILSLLDRMQQRGFIRT